MKTEKLNFANLQRLTRKEMKTVMGGLTTPNVKCPSLNCRFQSECSTVTGCSCYNAGAGNGYCSTQGPY